MKQISNVLCAVSLLAMVSCSNKSEEAATIRLTSVEADIEGTPLTRMSNTSFDKEDAIGISVVASDDYLTTGDNVKYVTLNGDGKFDADEDPICYADDKTASFIAYYPYTESENISDGKISVNTTKQADQKEFDYLYGTTNGSMNNVRGIRITFTHRMAKITFNIKAGNGVSADDIPSKLGSTYRVEGLKLTGTFNSLNGTAEVAEDAKASTLTPSIENTSIIILPQSPEEDLALAITYNGVDYTTTAAVPEGGFVAGNNYLYNVTVDLKSVRVSNSTIIDWNPKEQDGVNAQFPYEMEDETDDFDFSWGEEYNFDVEEDEDVEKDETE